MSMDDYFRYKNIGSSNKSSATSKGGIGICGGLFIAFVVLKLTNVIDWPWIWVISPLWIPVVLFILIILIMYAIVIFINKK